MSRNTNDSFIVNAFHVAKPIVSLGPDNTFLDVRNTMLKYNIKRIVVVDSSLPEKKQLVLLPKRI